MDRKWKSGASVTPPTLDNASDGYATAGNPALGVPASKPGPHWFHSITEELLALITAAGLTPDKASVVQLLGAANLLYDSQGIDPGGRLTLTAATPVTTADVSGATTTRYAPYTNDRIKLYDGTRWKWYTFTEVSQTLADTTKSPAATAASKTYDKFAWDDAGTFRCTRGPLWDTGGGSNIIRGTGAGSTELEFFGGRWVNKFAITNGPAARRGLMVGTVGTNAGNTVDDKQSARFLWNTFNRVERLLQAPLETADSWTYTTNALRQANANTANQFDFLVGLSEDLVSATIVAGSSNSSGLVEARVAVGLDSVTTMATGALNTKQASQVANGISAMMATWVGYPGLGRHYLSWLELSVAAGTTTFYGDSGAPTTQQSGLVGRMRA